MVPAQQLTWWHYQETLSSENWWQVPWMTRLTSPSLDLYVCAAHFPCPLKLQNTHSITQSHKHKHTHTHTNGTTRCTHASTLPSHKNVRSALCTTHELDTLGCTIAYRRTGWHSLIYLYHKLLSCVYVLFHPASTVISPPSSQCPGSETLMGWGCWGGVSATTLFLWILVVQAPGGWFGNLPGNKNLTSPLLLLLLLHLLASLHRPASELKTPTVNSTACTTVSCFTLRMGKPHNTGRH